MLRSEPEKPPNVSWRVKMPTFSSGPHQTELRVVRTRPLKKKMINLFSLNYIENVFGNDKKIKNTVKVRALNINFKRCRVAISIFHLNNTGTTLARHWEFYSSRLKKYFETTKMYSCGKFNVLHKLSFTFFFFDIFFPLNVIQ